jgi:hypothetical protein
VTGVKCNLQKYMHLELVPVNNCIESIAKKNRVKKKSSGMRAAKTAESQGETHP